jgi:hypothetical protein
MYGIKSLYRFGWPALLAVTVAASGGQLKEDFENVPVGKLPAKWHADATHPSSDAPLWSVEAAKDVPSGKRVLRLENLSGNRGYTFNLCYTKGIDFQDGEISVRFRADSGRIDEGGGIMWRVQDHNNYYVARFNPLEDNFRFYIVKNGSRHELASADIKLSKGWHTMRILQHGDRFEGYLDGKKLLEQHNDQLKRSGGVGLWTKADAATSFDDFTVRRAQ